MAVMTQDMARALTEAGYMPLAEYIRLHADKPQPIYDESGHVIGEAAPLKPAKPEPPTA